MGGIPEVFFYNRVRVS